MVQIVKFVDVAKGYAVIDPNAFAENLSYTTGEDAPETGTPILAFAGYNFLPTAYGYRSFFGIDSSLDIGDLPKNCSKMFLYQFASRQNILIALCEDGIYTTRPNSSGASWVGDHHYGWIYHDWLGGRGMIMGGEGTDSLEGQVDLREWTYTVMSNVLYIYRAGDPEVAKIGPLDITGETVTITYLTPTFLNMAGQMGIFRANGRLGFWDSANSVSWSSLFDPMDQTPALETLAGNATFKDITGTIITILPQGQGFIIYTTKGIVGVRFTTNGPVPWEANAVSDIAGIAYPFQVTAGVTDAEHFAYTSAGIYRIGKYSAVTQNHQLEPVIPDVYDMLKESREPVYLDFINGRFLFISLISPKYILGGIDFNTTIVGDLSIRILINNGGWDGVELLPITVDSRFYETEVYVPGDIIPPDYTTTPPSTDTIYHTEIETHLANQLGGAPNPDSAGFIGPNGERITMGNYTKWRGNGKAMFDGRNKATVKPYTVDINSNHIRNTPIDLSTTLPPSLTLIKDLTEADITAAYVPVQTEVMMEGGWVYPGPNQIGMNVLGNIDIHMKEMAITQMNEWDTFSAIIQTNNGVLNGLGTAGDITDLPTIYPDAAVAATALAGLIITTGAGRLNVVSDEDSVTYTEFQKDITSGTSPEVTQKLSGQGTSSASYKLTSTWTGGVTLKKIKTHSFLVKQIPLPPIPPGEVDALALGPQILNAYLGHPVLPTFYAVATGTTSDLARSEATSKVLSSCPPSITVSGAGYTETWTVIPYVVNGSGNYSIQYNAHRVFDDPEIPPTDNVYAAYSAANQSPYTGVPPVVEYYIEQTTSYDIDGTAPAENFSLTSEITLNQKVLDWGLATLDPAVEEEYYDPDEIGPVPKYKFGPGEMKKFSVTAGAYTIPGASVPGGATYPLNMEALYPGSSFLIPDGASAPAYPTFVGAFVLDTGLKKWGKMRNSYKVLLDIAPVNALTPYIPATNFGIDMGILDSLGRVYRMDNIPFLSTLTYGKIGFYRAGVIQAQEVKVHFRDESSGWITVDSSLDGRLADMDSQYTEFFFGKLAVTVYPTNVGVWQTVTINGNYDLSYLEFRGTIAGRR